MGTPLDPPSGFLNVPQLIAALCYHLAVQDCENIYNILSRSKVRDDLYGAYKDVAFSQLFGLCQREGPSGDPWTYTTDDLSLKSGEECTIGQGSTVPENAHVAKLKDRLIHGIVGGPLGVDLQYGNHDETESQPIHFRCDLLIPDGFEGNYMAQQTSFLCSEGENVCKFLECLKGSVESEDSCGSDWYDGKQCDYVHNQDFNRGMFVNEIPDPEFFPGPLPKDMKDGRGYHRPGPRGWFIEQHPGQKLAQNAQGVKSPSVEATMVYQPSKSPVKVSLGSLFIDNSPGKMTLFEHTHPTTDTGEGREASRRNVLRQLEAMSHDQTAQASSHKHPGAYILKSKKLWGGEESEIAREALLAMSGVRASLSKLRGRLIMPQALPRPAIAPILSDMEKASSSRASIQCYINMVLQESSLDPVSLALANSLKEVLNDIDKKLVALEMYESKNWVQPLGIASDTNSKNSLFSNYSQMERLEDSTTCSHGAEYHGTGVSILSLAHATSQSQSILVFLESFLDLCTISQKSIRDYPRGRSLLEFLYNKSVLLEGEQAQVTRRLFLAALSPFLSVIGSWAFGVEPLNEANCFVGLLSREYSVRLPNQSKEISGRWISGLGPSNIPSFFSDECNKSVLVSGTQLRLLYSVAQPANGESDCSSESCCPGNTKQCDKHWFPCLEDLHRQLHSSDQYKANVLIEHEKSDALKSKQEMMKSWLSSMEVYDVDEVGPAILNVDSLESVSSSDIPLPVLLETSLGNVLKSQASMVSRACLHLFIDTLDTFGLLQFMRNMFMGFTGDFQSEFLRILEPSVHSLEPLTLHKVISALRMASSNSCLHDSKYTEKLTVSLLPAENAMSLAHEAFAHSSNFADVSRIKSPFHSAMRPILVPPTGFDAFDCINVSFDPSWPMAVILSDDTLTAYSAIFSMHLRLKRAHHALESIHSLFCGRILVKELSSFELVPWIGRFKILCSLRFRASRHLEAILQFYQSHCCGESWNLLRSVCSQPLDGSITIHDLIQAHREYIYGITGKMITCCNNPSMTNTIQEMLESILDLKGTLEAKLREANGVKSAVFSDNSSWQDLKRQISKYNRHADTMRGYHSHFEIPVTDDERNMKNFLQCFVSQ